jgi:hypothetical protein
MNPVQDGISQIHSFSRRSIENVSCTSSDWFQKNYLDRYFFQNHYVSWRMNGSDNQIHRNHVVGISTSISFEDDNASRS